MAKITRKAAKQFGSSATANQIAKYGSLAAGSPVRYSGVTADPDNIQALTQYLQGWFAAVTAGNSPAMEDQNALSYLWSYQIAYLMQAGIAEYDSTTTYYIGSLVNSSGQIYVSLTDNNTGNALTSTTNWRPYSNVAKTKNINPAVDSPVTIASTDISTVYFINSANGTCTFNLPATVNISAGFSVRFKDTGGVMNTSNTTLVRNGSQKIESLSSNFALSANYGRNTLMFDGTDWWFV